MRRLWKQEEEAGKEAEERGGGYRTGKRLKNAGGLPNERFEG